MCLYLVVHYGPNPFSLKRIFSRRAPDADEQRISEWRVERLSLDRLRELWDLIKVEKDDDFDMGY